MSPPATLIYASPTGGGGSAGTKADPASLTHALALARAALPGPVWIILRAGTYFLAGTLALTQADNGIIFRNYPGETWEISGATVISSSDSSKWTDDGSGQSVSFATYSGTATELFVDGVRMQRSFLDIRADGWTLSAGGFTMAGTSATTIGSAAHKLQVEAFSTTGGWMIAINTPASISGTAFNLGSTALTNYNSAPATPFLPPVMVMNLREFITGSTPGTWCNSPAESKVYLKLPAGKSFATSLITVGGLQQVVTLTGTRSVPCTVQFVGGTISGAGWPMPAEDYCSEQTGAYGFRGNSTDGPTTQINMVVQTLPGGIECQYFAGCFKGCTIKNMAARGIHFGVGCQNATVMVGCTLTGNGGAGYSFGDVTNAVRLPSSTSDWTTGLTFTDCTIGKNAVRYSDDAQGFGGFVSNIAGIHNAYTGGPSSNRATGWGWWSNLASPQAVLGGNTESFSTFVGCFSVSLLPSGTAIKQQGLGDIYFVGLGVGSGVRSCYFDGATAASSPDAAVYFDGGSDTCTADSNVSTIDGPALVFLGSSGTLGNIPRITVTNNFYDSGMNATREGIAATDVISNNTAVATPVTSNATAAALKAIVGPR